MLTTDYTVTDIITGRTIRVTPGTTCDEVDKFLTSALEGEPLMVAREVVGRSYESMSYETREMLAGFTGLMISVDD